MSKILVTGANGYIGRYVVAELLKAGHEVFASDICLEGLDTRAKLCSTPIFSSDPNLYHLLGSPDICIHLAWRDAFLHNSDVHMADLSKHITFCKNMIAGGLPSLSVMGTMHEVGYWEGAIDEDTPCNPQNQYGIAKNAMRQSLLQTTAQEKTELHWLRAYYIVSSDPRGSNIFSKIIQASNAGKKCFPFTSGKNMYDFINIEDLAKMIVATSTQTRIKGIINVCSGEPEALGSRVERFISENRLCIRLEYGAYPDRTYDSLGVWGDATLIKQVILNSDYKLDIWN